MYNNTEDFIKKIPMIYPNDSKISKEFIIEKLLEANRNKDIIMLARGDGRNNWNKYIKSDDFFYWGVKSEHGYKDYISNWLLKGRLSENELRQLLNPGEYSIELLIALLNQIEYSLNWYKEKMDIKEDSILKYKENKYNNIIKKYNSIKLGINNVQNQDDLFYLKFEMCRLLHIMGNPVYKNKSPYISTAKGDNRYKIACRFAGNKYARVYKEKQNTFVILDYWVNMNENKHKFFIVKECIKVLEKYNVKFLKSWYDEVLLMYAMFPHQIVGYYYFENDKLLYYKINPFYLKEWENDIEFKIGDSIYIPQQINDIGDDFPFDRIYTDNGEFIVQEI